MAVARRAPIPSQMRDRVMACAEVFDNAFNAFNALDGNDRSLERLDEATDRLMRAAARILIELHTERTG
jgi:hypothetical protein